MSDQSEYELVYTRTFRKELEKHSRQNQKRVLSALDEIKKNPHHPAKSTKLTNFNAGQFRWRIGDLRIIYDIEETQVFLLHVLKREDAYRRRG
jgi:mRNA interferase RelE/StbE